MGTIKKSIHEDTLMLTENNSAAHGLYVVYETLPDDVQNAFLQEFLQKQQEKLETMAFGLACRQAKEENEFLSDEDCLAFIAKLPQ
jgi:hypothetical protein